MNTTDFFKLPLASIETRYERLRIVRPELDTAMHRSMKRYGQLSALVVGLDAKNQHQLVDGFKRLRAGRKLGYQSLDVKLMPGSENVHKAAMVNLNLNARAMADIEAGMIIRSMHREDHLSQTEIALLVQRHKSWVCRRLSLVERLEENVLDHIGLGLLGITIARELSLLPRGNQTAAMKTILQHKLTTKQAAGLVKLLMQAPKKDYDRILSDPASRFGDRSSNSDLFFKTLLKIEALVARLSASTAPQDVCRVWPVIERIEASMERIKGHFSPQEIERC